MPRICCLAILSLLSLSACADLNAPLLLQSPTMNRTPIVFVYAGDLWKVPREGGDGLQNLQIRGQIQQCGRLSDVYDEHRVLRQPLFGRLRGRQSGRHPAQHDGHDAERHRDTLPCTVRPLGAAHRHTSVPKYTSRAGDWLGFFRPQIPLLSSAAGRQSAPCAELWHLGHPVHFACSTAARLVCRSRGRLRAVIHPRNECSSTVLGCRLLTGF